MYIITREGEFTENPKMIIILDQMMLQEFMNIMKLFRLSQVTINTRNSNIFFCLPTSRETLAHAWSVLLLLSRAQGSTATARTAGLGPRPDSLTLDCLAQQVEWSLVKRGGEGCAVITHFTFKKNHLFTNAKVQLNFLIKFV